MHFNNSLELIKFNSWRFRGFMFLICEIDKMNLQLFKSTSFMPKFAMLLNCNTLMSNHVSCAVLLIMSKVL